MFKPTSKETIETYVIDPQDYVAFVDEINGWSGKWMVREIKPTTVAGRTSNHHIVVKITQTEK